jgi:hypothetical protein
MNNVRTDNILAAAAEVTKIREIYYSRATWLAKAEADYKKKQEAMEDIKERLSYALRKLEVATA